MFGWLFGRRFDRELRALQGHVLRLAKNVAELSTKLSTAVDAIDASSQAQLQARVMELERALEQFSRTQRKELGALHKQVALLETRDPPEPEPETADDVRARLRAQLPIPKIGKGT